ncbi:Yip1 family protein [uncultured Amphritea sp.]|uniref:Yip1 family protein n=1 Tax=uncultured Amphritea sp. TaxID=981605 RepID=UPI0026332C82|nr:Yip1 family protein [uncultured Amphritea sp.]
MSIPIIDMKPNGPDEIDQRVEEDALRCIKEAEHYALRPVLGMMHKPKITIRKILDLDYPIKYAVLLIFIAGIAQSLNTYISLPESASIQHFVIVTSAGGIGTLITSLVLLAIIRGVGRLFSGRASYRDLIQAWGWSSVPSIVLMLVWGLRYAIVGPEFFSLDADVQVREPVLDRVLLYLVFVQVGVMVWQAILTFICIQVVQQLNFFKTFALAIICAIISIFFYAFMATIFG